MTDHDDAIEGEYTPEPAEQALAPRDEQAQQVALYTPLDVSPVAFKRHLEQRQENYDQLAMHLRGVLVPDKDFGRIHVMPKDRCEKPWQCTIDKNPGHFSDWTLFASGADKILGILGLAVGYPGLNDYKRAVLKGYELQEILADAQILGANGQAIASGAGACARKEVHGSLNNCIKRACKRARLDAVKRLPVVSALFEADFLAEVAQQAARNQGNSTSGRARQVRNKWDTGAKLEVCPIGRFHRNKPWREIPTDALEWFAANCGDKPDVQRAAAAELSQRRDRAGPGSDSQGTPSPPASPEEEYFDGGA